MNGVKTTLGELCENEGKSLLQAVSLTSKLAAAFVAHAPDLNDIGVRILQVGAVQHELQRRGPRSGSSPPTPRSRRRSARCA